MNQPKDIAKLLVDSVVRAAVDAPAVDWPEETSVTMSVREYMITMGIVWADMAPDVDAVRAHRSGHEAIVVFALTKDQQHRLVGMCQMDERGARHELYEQFLSAAQNTLREMR